MAEEIDHEVTSPKLLDGDREDTYSTPNREDLEQDSKVTDSMAKKRKIATSSKRGTTSDIRGYFDGEGKRLFSSQPTMPRTYNNSQKNTEATSLKRNLFAPRITEASKTFNFLNLEGLNSTYQQLGLESADNTTPTCENAIAKIKQGIDELKSVVGMPGIKEKETTEPKTVDEDPPRDMSLQQIIEMLHNMNISLTGIKKEIDNIRFEQGRAMSQTRLLAQVAENTAQVLAEQQNEQMDQKWKVNRLIDYMVTQNQKIQEVVNAEERRQLKEGSHIMYIDNVIEERHENTVEVARDFIQKTLKVVNGFQVNKAFRTGLQEPRSICVHLGSAQERSLIFGNVKELKDAKNSNNQRYYINKQLPARIREEKKRGRSIIKNNFNLPRAQQANVEKGEDGEIYIDDIPYEKAIKVPKPEEILRQKPTEREQRRKITITKGNIVHVEDSTFIGYSAFVDSFDDITKAYQNVKEKHADARHVCCAFRLPGIEIALLQDYVDDEEPGGGRKLLDLLEELDTFNRAVFVARYYDGNHIGPERFHGMRSAALSAIIKTPINKYTGINELSWSKDAQPDCISREYAQAVRGELNIRQPRATGTRYTGRRGRGNKQTYQRSNKKYTGKPKITTGPGQSDGRRQEDNNTEVVFDDGTQAQRHTMYQRKDTPYKSSYSGSLGATSSEEV